ncbi:hypothetical protein UZ36_07245 [Candidatus Nitromaritima sp. SCGC AAA799-C22]|nr:hypothetical protein UZ36_07245 [Candidatus Nitromaritima sp. SCGC AAA799-C22]
MVKLSGLFRLVFLFWIFASTVLAEERVKSITVVGEAPIINANVLEARNNALEEAFRTAIRKLIGTYVTAGNYTRNFESIENSIITRTKGYVKSYDVLKEWEENQIVYRQVSVKLSMDPMLDKLTELGILIQSMGNPRIAVLIFQQNEAGEFIYDSSATHAVKNHFVGVGFQVMDFNPFSLIKDEEHFRGLFNGDPELIDSMARQTGAEILVLGRGTASNQTVASPVGMYAALVNLHVKLIKPQTKRTLVSLSEKNNGAGLTPEAALTQAFKRTGETITPHLVHNLAEKWNSELLNGRDVTMEVVSQDYESFNKFRNRVEKIFGVVSVVSKTFENGRGQIDLKFTGSPQTLADLIVITDFYDFKVTIRGFTDEKIDLRIQ